MEADRLNFSPVLKTMKDEKLDALVAMEPHTVALLMNYWNELFFHIAFKQNPTCVVITSLGDIFAVMPTETHFIEYAPWISEFVGQYTMSSYHDQGKMVKTLAQALRGKGLASAKVGFEMGFVPAGIMDSIERELPAMEAVDCEWILWQLRAVKTEKQLGFIKDAIAGCEAGIEKMLAGWKEGESIHRLLDQFEQVVRGHGASVVSIPQRNIAKKWVPFAGRDQIVSEDFIIRANDVEEVHFDFLVRCQGYFSDWKRSIYLGTPSKEIVDLYDSEWRAVKALAEEVRPGMSTAEAQEACERRLRREGLVTWWCIHSVGLEIHEEPLIGASPTISKTGEIDISQHWRFPGLVRTGHEKITFEPNVVVMVETKLTEDPYLMTDSGLKRLNRLPQQLFVI